MKGVVGVRSVLLYGHRKAFGFGLGVKGMKVVRSDLHSWKGFMRIVLQLNRADDVAHWLAQNRALTDSCTIK